MLMLIEVHLQTTLSIADPIENRKSRRGHVVSPVTWPCVSSAPQSAT